MVVAVVPASPIAIAAPVPILPGVAVAAVRALRIAIPVAMLILRAMDAVVQNQEPQIPTRDRTAIAADGDAAAPLVKPTAIPAAAPIRVAVAGLAGQIPTRPIGQTMAADEVPALLEQDDLRKV